VKKIMQQVTSTSHQVTLNTTQSVKNRFGFETNWKQVTNPSGSNVIARAVNAVVAVFVNLAKALVNLTLWPLNTVHRLIFGKPANTITIEDDIEIQQDTVTLDIAESNQINDETIPEPVVVESSLQNWQKAALAATVVLVGTLALARGTQYFTATANKAPILPHIDNFVFGTIPNGISNGVSSGTSALKNTFCWATFGKFCKA
jgi:hypothetical protein